MRPPMLVGPRSVHVPSVGGSSAACALARMNIAVVSSWPDASRFASQ